MRPGNRAVVHHVIVFDAAAEAGAASGRIPRAPGMDDPAAVRAAAGEAEGRAEARARAEPVPARRSASARRSAASLPAPAPCNSSQAPRCSFARARRMVVQMHYTTNGTAQTDRTKLGLFFAKEMPKVEMRMGTLINGQLDIPAGAPDYSIAAEMTTVGRRHAAADAPAHAPARQELGVHGDVSRRPHAK